MIKVGDVLKGDGLCKFVVEEIDEVWQPFEDLERPARIRMTVTMLPKEYVRQGAVQSSG